MKRYRVGRKACGALWACALVFFVVSLALPAVKVVCLAFAFAGLWVGIPWALAEWALVKRHTRRAV